MEENNLLNRDVSLLYEIKGDLVRNNELASTVSRLSDEERSLSKQLDSAKKKLASEINTTISKRRTEVESSFSSRLNMNRSRLKKAHSRRASEKNSKVTMRIETETGEFREEMRKHKEEIKSIFTKNSLPRVLNNAFFYNIFMPEKAVDYCVIGGSVLVVLLLPLLVGLVLLPEKMQGALAVFLFYVLFIGLFGFLYFFIRKNWYMIKKREFRNAKKHRDDIKKLKKKIAKKEEKIRNDSDESGYELEKFDLEINDIQRQIDLIVEEKKNALTLFENRTKHDIIEEINSRYISEIQENEQELEKVRTEKHLAESELNELAVKISKSYEVYLGKDAMSVPVIESLIDIMNNGEAKTISEAVEQYKVTVDKGLQTP